MCFFSPNFHLFWPMIGKEVLNNTSTITKHHKNVKSKYTLQNNELQFDSSHSSRIAENKNQF